jgi:dTDP-4-dehydrorhamnose 3,5-epimerase
MRFEPTPIQGSRLVELERRGDDRGFFARLFCEREFSRAGLDSRFVQINNSLSAQRGTLRGLHYQLPPSAETKVVRCVRGALWDVIVDLRPGSRTFRRWFAVEFTAEDRRMLVVPRGCAHGFITLVDDTEVIYLVSAFHDAGAERGLRWDDPWHGIEWPAAPTTLSHKDRHWPLFDPAFHGVEAFRE